MDQRRMWPLPIYQIYQIEGMPHASGHSWSVQVRNSAGAVVVEAVGHGVTKKSAQMQAAESALEEIRARGC
jgi:dsRNA-specific ribonuclease